jgi:hypothetical protein
MVTALGEISSSVRKRGSGIVTDMNDEEPVDGDVDLSLDWE